MNLQTLQEKFQSELLNPATFARKNWIAHTPNNPWLSASTRLKVYQHAYVSRLLNTLQEMFPVTWSWLGDTAFEQLAKSYIQRHPSVNPDLGQYGKYFARHAAKQLNNDQEVAELITLEWASHTCFCSADCAPLSAEQLQGISPEAWSALHLRLVPSCVLIPLRFNTFELWQSLKQERAPDSIHELKQTQHLLIWRKKYQVHYRVPSGEESEYLKQLQQGLSFEALCDKVMLQKENSVTNAHAESAQEAGQFLAHWLMDELLQQSVKLPR